MQAEMLDSTISQNSQELPNASSALKLFENPQFRVRVIMRCAEPWFVASDACDGLALSNVSEALSDLDEDDKLKLTKDELDTLISNEGIKCSVDSRVQTLNLVSESGLYDLIMQSRKPEAKAFKRWVTHEVLPSIRKTGSYSVNQTQQQSMMCLPQDYESALEALLTEVRKNKALQAELTSEKEAHEKDNEDFRNGFDIVNAQKAQIGSTREATAMATASSAKARQRFAEKVLETHASELITLRAVVDEQRSHLWDANRMAHDIYKLNVLKKEYSMNTLQTKARELLSHFAEKLGKRSTPLPNGATYPDSLGRLQPSISMYYEKDVADAALNWVVENTNKFAHIGGKKDPLRDE